MPDTPIRALLEYYGWSGRSTGYGPWQTIHCPFHGDRKSSGRINEDEGVFHCHACGISGNAIKCVEQHEGVTWDEAKRRVQEITGHDGSELRPGPASGGFLRRSGSKLPEWARAKHGRLL